MNFSELCEKVDTVTPRGFYTSIHVIRTRQDEDISDIRFQWEVYVCNYSGGYRESAPHFRVAGTTIDQAYQLFMAQTVPWIDAQLGKVDKTDQSALVDVGEFAVPPGEDDKTVFEKFAGAIPAIAS